MIRAFVAVLLAALLISPAVFAQFPGYPPANYFYVGNGTASEPQWLSPGAARTAMGVVASGFSPTGGRLTLQSNTPVMITTQAAKPTLFFDCFGNTPGGGYVAVWNGVSDQLLQIPSCQTSTAMQSGGTGVLNAAGVFDVWGVNSSGNLAICIATNGAGGGWASDVGGSATARGTGYSQLDYTTRSFVTNKNALANCYNGSTNLGSIAANQATHLGTIGTDPGAAGVVSWQYGATAATPTAAIFNVWNRFNRVANATTTFGSTTTSWTYVGTTWRQANQSAFTTLQVTYTVGDVIDGIHAEYETLSTSSTTAVGCMIGIGVDSTTVTSGAAGYNTVASAMINSGRFIGIPSLGGGTGQHKVSALENATGATCTFFGGSAGQNQGMLLFVGPSM